LKFGIYLAYGPRMDLRTEGLGRQLAEFIRAAREHDDIEVVVAAPSWLRGPLEDLMDAFSIDRSALMLVGPPRASWIWQLWSAYETARVAPQTKVRSRGRGLVRKVRAIGRAAGSLGLAAFVAPRNVLLGALVVFLLLIAAVVASPVWLILSAVYLGALALMTKRPGNLLGRIGARIVRAAKGFQQRLGRRLYKAITSSEARHVAKYADREAGVAIWYSPTAFWPEFALIRGPRLTCLPDVLPVNFPLGFSLSGGDAMAANVRTIAKVIAKGGQFVTYSDEVKWGTLVQRFNVRPSTVQVVPHGANQLQDLVATSGFPDNEATSRALCGYHLSSALSKCVNNPAAPLIVGPESHFIFYASQFRPNKNVLTLLLAYRYLRQVKGLPLKLILTGDPAHDRDFRDFVAVHRLQDDVLCLRGLSEAELASCYKLARVAANPSLMEGGMPFTFTEALSVGTPVVMADIAVTREIIDDEAVRSATLFDPYDWMRLAESLERALAEPAALLAVQLPFYRRLAGRTWAHAVYEYIDLMKRVAAAPR